MNGSPSREIIEEAQREFRALRKASDEMASDRSGDSGWALYGYAAHQVELLDARIRHLGVDLSRGFDPLYFFPGAKPPRTAKQQGELHKTAWQLHRWVATWLAGARVIYSDLGDTTLSAVVARYRGRPLPELDVASRVADIGARALVAMLDTWERHLVYTAGALMEEMPEQAQRSVARDVFTAWARENISLWGQVGTRLRSALELQRVEADGQDAPINLDKILLRELPGAIAEAWRSTNPEEPLRSTGDRRMSLRRRIAKILEDEGGQQAKEPGLIASTLDEEFALDAATSDFEASEEAARQVHDALVARAGLSPQQVVVWQGVRAGLSPEEIAEELGISRNQVDVQKHNAIEKLRVASRAAAL